MECVFSSFFYVAFKNCHVTMRKKTERNSPLFANNSTIPNWPNSQVKPTGPPKGAGGLKCQTDQMGQSNKTHQPGQSGQTGQPSQVGLNGTNKDEKGQKAR